MSESVLFVDDEQHVLNALQRVFADSALETVFTRSPVEALELCRSKKFAVIVSDNMMPKIKGLELLTRIKEESPETVRCLLTAHADLATALQAINNGEVFRFIVKPWQNEELYQAVSEGIARFRLLSALRQRDEGILHSLAETIELKDRYTRGHCDRVAEYAVKICELLELPSPAVREIRYGSWLHDCGKIGVPETILNSTSMLSEQEMIIVWKHPEWGANVAQQAHLSPMVVNIIRHHHERFDGNGYPFRLKGMSIPLEARIVAVADVFDALTSDRPYKPAMSFTKARKIMEDMREIHLEGRLVDLFLQSKETAEQGPEG
jgi:putative nucleotidyltransferase with HDIG domain